MTKAQEKVARIAAAKREAFMRKVTTLLGHVRVDRQAALKSFDEGCPAEVYAAAVATLEPVGKALHPAKADAVKEAGEDARRYVAKVRAELIAHGWDINAVAPFPYRLQGYAADVARMKHNNFHRLTKLDPAKGSQPLASRMTNEPVFVIMDDDGIAKFVEMQERQAALYYDAFILKMVAKVGEVVSAKIDGSHVWSHSILTVTLPGGEVQRWKTQQITNVSKLGLQFPQWPSRLMKGGA